ncbi:FKBP-type peptidyl-prolyl cis-trans isomerase [Leptospira levettii]
MFLLVLPIASAEKDFQIIDLVIGKGDEAFSGSYVTVHYVGKLQNGTKFDSSRDRNRPFEFNLGAGEVVKGWDKGIKGMRVGGKRKLIIPPELGYGSKRVGNIPPDSTLIFEVELLKIY